MSENFTVIVDVVKESYEVVADSTFRRGNRECQSCKRTFRAFVPILDQPESVVNIEDDSDIPTNSRLYRRIIKKANEKHEEELIEASWEDRNEFYHLCPACSEKADAVRAQMNIDK